MHECMYVCVCMCVCVRLFQVLWDVIHRGNYVANKHIFSRSSGKNATSPRPHRSLVVCLTCL